MPFNEALDFTRGSSATARTATGNIQGVLTDEQRLVGNREGLLIEEARTNLVTYSEQFDNAAWSKTGASISADATIAPDGLTSADAVTEDSGGTSEHKVIQSITTIAGEIVFTVFVKKKDGGRDWFFIREAIDGSLTNSFYNIEDGTLGAIGSGKIGSIENAGNGWFRVALTQTATAQTSNLSFGIAESDGAFNYTGDGTSGIYVWGAQVEQGSFPSSYIPTAGAQVTRAADDCVRVLGDEFNQTEGSIFIELNNVFELSEAGIIFQISIGTDYNNRIGVLLDVDDEIKVFIQKAGSFFLASLGQSGKRSAKIAASYDSNELRMSVDGSSIVTLPVASVFSGNLSRLELGERGNSNRTNMTARDFRIIPAALSEAELITLTGGN
jgi:hypothetical protein